MIDALFGDLGDILAAVAGTDVFSANYIDLGSIASKSRFTEHALAPELRAVFSNSAAALAAIDSYTPFIYHDTASGFATNNSKALVGDTTALGLAAGTLITMRVPIHTHRYIELGVTPVSTGVFTAVTISGWFEFGVQPTVI